MVSSCRCNDEHRRALFVDRRVRPAMLVRVLSMIFKRLSHRLIVMMVMLVVFAIVPVPVRVDVGSVGLMDKMPQIQCAATSKRQGDKQDEKGPRPTHANSIAPKRYRSAPREQPRVNLSRPVNQRGREFERVALDRRPPKATVTVALVPRDHALRNRERRRKRLRAETPADTGDLPRSGQTALGGASAAICFFTFSVVVSIMHVLRP